MFHKIWNIDDEEIAMRSRKRPIQDYKLLYKRFVKQGWYEGVAVILAGIFTLESYGPRIPILIIAGILWVSIILPLFMEHFWEHMEFEAAIWLGVWPIELSDVLRFLQTLLSWGLMAIFTLHQQKESDAFKGLWAFYLIVICLTYFVRLSNHFVNFISMRYFPFINVMSLRRKFSRFIISLRRRYVCFVMFLRREYHHFVDFLLRRG